MVYRKIQYVAIEFEMRNYELGFWVTFRIPYSTENYQGVLGLRQSANIRKIRAEG